MAWVARGKCKALGKKKSSTPAVVPGAAPALATAGVGGYHMLVGNVSFFGTMPMTEVSTLGSSINTKRQLGPASSAAEGVGCAEGMVLGNECGYSHGFHRKIDNSCFPVSPFCI